jgi:tripartite ATP-independent transporter DctM subunit
MLLFIFLGGLILFFLAGFAVPYAIGLVSLVVMVFKEGFGDIPFTMLAQRIVFGMNSFVLLAIPLFLLAGKLMNTGSITRKIFRFANLLIGFLPGGLGHVNVVSSMIFAGMSGSAVADAAGLGTIEVKAMTEEGYDREFSAAITAASSTIGPIIPPSIPLIMFGVMGNVSITSLLIGGLVPGALMGVSLMIMCYYYGKKRNYPRRKFPTFKEFWSGLKEAFWPLLTPAILIGGILSGVFTPTEAAGVAVVYAFILTLVYRELTLREFIKISLETVKESAMIFVIIGMASIYGWLLIKTQMPQMFVEGIFMITENPLFILLILNVFFLIVGCFMESIAAITILTPLMVPLAIGAGIDPLHLGLVMVLNLMIGLLTPPVGMCLYAVSRVANVSFDKLVKAVSPFYIPLFIVLLLLTIFPVIGTFLPNLVFGR